MTQLPVTARDDFVALIRKMHEEPGELLLRPASGEGFSVSLSDERPRRVLRATFHGDVAEDRLPPGWEPPDRWKMPRREWDRDVDPGLIADEILAAVGELSGVARNEVEVHVDHRYVDTTDLRGSNIIGGVAMLPIAILAAAAAVTIVVVLGRPILPALAGALVGIVAGIWVGFRLIESAEAQMTKVPRARRDRAYHRRLYAGLAASGAIPAAAVLLMSATLS